jgi:hypothetical protein
MNAPAVRALSSHHCDTIMIDDKPVVASTQAIAASQSSEP